MFVQVTGHVASELDNVSAVWYCVRHAGGFDDLSPDVVWPPTRRWFDTSDLTWYGTRHADGLTMVRACGSGSSGASSRGYLGFVFGETSYTSGVGYSSPDGGASGGEP